MTKSVTALVLGVAIDRGIIADVDQSVLSFFPDYADLRTPERDRITIRHLLTMSMGLDWNDDAPYTNEDTLNRSLDPYRYVLSLPVVEPAGSVWKYSGGATALIGGILGRAGKRFDVLAATLLFDPLGVSDVAWTWLPNGDPKNWCCLWMRPRDMAKIGQLVLDRGRWNGGQVVSETWINAATAPQIKTIYRGLDYGFQFWLGASFVSGKRIDWVEAQGQGGQRIFIVPTLDLVTVVTAGNYYGNDRLANLVPQIVFDDYVLPAVDAVRWLLRCHRERLLRVDPSDAGGPANRRLRRDGCGHAWTPRRDFAVSKSVTQYLTVGSVACQKAGAHRVTLCADPVRARHGPTGGPARVASGREPRSPLPHSRPLPTAPRQAVPVAAIPPHPVRSARQPAGRDRSFHEWGVSKRAAFASRKDTR